MECLILWKFEVGLLLQKEFHPIIMVMIIDAFFSPDLLSQADFPCHHCLRWHIFLSRPRLCMWKWGTFMNKFSNWIIFWKITFLVAICIYIIHIQKMYIKIMYWFSASITYDSIKIELFNMLNIFNNEQSIAGLANWKGSSFIWKSMPTTHLST